MCCVFSREPEFMTHVLMAFNASGGDRRTSLKGRSNHDVIVNWSKGYDGEKQGMLQMPDPVWGVSR